MSVNYSPAEQQAHAIAIADSIALKAGVAPRGKQRGATRRVPQNDEELKIYLWDRFRIRIPDTQVCPSHSTPFRAFADAYFARFPVTVWKASRGLGGKSYLLALLGHCEADTLHAEVTILGGSGEQALRVLEYLQKFSGDEENTKRRTDYGGGGKVSALMASSKSARGPHPQRMRLDEVDEMELKILDAAMGQPMGTATIAKQTVMSSTHHYADATFTEVMKRAQEKGWPVHEWCVDGDADIMTPAGQVKMKDLSIGDTVYAHQKGRIIETRIADAWRSGVRPTLTITTELGSLRCTADHRILTSSGWREAGQLNEGDAVCIVRSRARSLRARPVSELSRRKQMSGLWYVNHGWREALRGLSGKDSHIAGSFKSREINMPYVQRPQDRNVPRVPQMFPSRTSSTERARSRDDGFSASTNRGLRQQPKAHQLRRDISPRAAFAFIYWLLRAAALWPLRGGFRLARFQGRRGGERKILAYEAGANGARSTEEGSDRIGRFDAPRTVDGRMPSMGVATIRRIENSDTIPVYDITVTEGSSFIANGIVVHNCYKETSAEPDGWLTLEEIESKRGDVTAAMWSAEYDLQEPSPEGRAILPEKVDACFKKELGEFEGKLGEAVTIEEPIPGATYATGADWAKKKDFTIIDTLRTDVRPMRRVAWVRLGRMAWPTMIGKFNDRVTKYTGEACHDATGLGDVVGDYQVVNAEGVVLSGQTRADVFTRYIAAIENGTIESPAIRYCEGEHRYCTNDDLNGSGHPPDSFVAGAMAYRAANSREWNYA